MAVLPYGRAQEQVNLAASRRRLDDAQIGTRRRAGRAGPTQGRSRRPANGATDVDTVTEIRIRFDRPMDPNRLELNWGLGVAGFRLRGTGYDADTHEFVIPVWLTPGSRHNVKAGNKSRVHSGKFEGFESVDHVAAAPFSWSFTTAKPPSKSGTPPRILSVDPPTDSEVAQLIPVKVTFDQPMDPNSYGVTGPGTSDPFRGIASSTRRPSA